MIRLLNGRIGLLVPEVRFARRAIKGTALAVYENCDFRDVNRDYLQARFSHSNMPKVLESQTLKFSIYQTLKVSKSQIRTV